MKKERRSRRQPGRDGEASTLTRTTVFLTENLDRNLDILAIQENRPKGELIREILADHLRGQKLDPDRRVVRLVPEYA